MYLSVDPHSGVPVYRQMIDQIRFQIDSGALAPGASLPSTRAVSMQLGINPMTVSKVYGMLESEGLIERRPGLALVVARRSAERERRGRELQLEQILTPAVTASRLLGLDADTAVGLFQAMLRNSRRPR
jgi:GntR family transcriptional regulator